MVPHVERRRRASCAKQSHCAVARCCQMPQAVARHRLARSNQTQPLLTAESGTVSSCCYLTPSVIVGGAVRYPDARRLIATALEFYVKRIALFAAVLTLAACAAKEEAAPNADSMAAAAAMAAPAPAMDSAAMADSAKLDSAKVDSMKVDTTIKK